jgi:hypothetical protein
MSTIDDDKVWHKDTSYCRVWVDGEDCTWVGMLDDDKEVDPSQVFCVSANCAELEELIAALQAAREGWGP